MPTAIPTATAMRDQLKREEVPNLYHHFSLDDYQARVWDVYRMAENVIPECVHAYAAFCRQLRDQWYWMISEGVRVEFCDEDPTAINHETGTISARAFFDDYREHNVLRVFRSQDADHPLLGTEHIEHNGRRENMNTVFRAVHDWFGHLATGAGFGWRGETTAYYSHASMFTSEARAALFCETVAQQCGYAVTGDYVDQKCVFFGAEWHNPPLA